MNNSLLGLLIESGYCVPNGSDRSFLFNLYIFLKYIPINMHNLQYFDMVMELVE